MFNIAIQGHPTRGKEVIQILESLGGINICNHLGNNFCAYYEIHGNLIQCMCIKSDNYKYYTLEEFEKEFPFKIGDKAKHITSICIIKEYCYVNNKPCYKVESMELGIIATIPVKLLEPYKEMEIRNITLTLDKAKEWYKKGGELKEVALQAYSEEELSKVELPKTWEEFCNNRPIKHKECYITAFSDIKELDEHNETRSTDLDRNVCPSKKSAEAHLALIQLEQLRDCYRQGDIPNFNNCNEKYCIVKTKNDIHVVSVYDINRFLSFTKKEVAEKFLINFKPLIKIAEDYI